MKLLIRLISALGITKKNRKAIRNTIRIHSEVVRFYFNLVFSCHVSNRKRVIKLFRENGLKFPHPIGIVLWDTKIGKNVEIFQNTTIANNVIEIQDEVRIYPSCVIHGNITIGKGAIIGANSYVDKNVPPYELWAGSPAVFIKKLNKAKEF